MRHNFRDHQLTDRGIICVSSAMTNHWFDMEEVERNQIYFGVEQQRQKKTPFFFEQKGEFNGSLRIYMLSPNIVITSATFLHHLLDLFYRKGILSLA